MKFDVEAGISGKLEHDSHGRTGGPRRMLARHAPTPGSNTAGPSNPTALTDSRKDYQAGYHQSYSFEKALSRLIPQLREIISTSLYAYAYAPRFIVKMNAIATSFVGAIVLSREELLRLCRAVQHRRQIILNYSHG